MEPIDLPGRNFYQAFLDSLGHDELCTWLEETIDEVESDEEFAGFVVNALKRRHDARQLVCEGLGCDVDV